MPKHWVLEDKIPKKGGGFYIYFKDAWYENGKLKKKRLMDSQGNIPKDMIDAQIMLRSRANGQMPAESTLITADGFREAFERQLTDDGASKSYPIYWGIIERVKDHLPAHIKDWDKTLVAKYLNSLSLSPATKLKYAKSISRFLVIAVRLGELKTNPFLGYEYKGQDPQPTPFPEEHIRKLISAAKALDKDYNTDYYTFIITAFQLNLRANEYMNLRVSKTDFNNATYTIAKDDTFDPKFSRKRIVKIPKLTLSLLKKLKDRLPDGCDYYFHKDGKRFNDHFPRDYWRAIFKAAGVEGDLDNIRETGASYRLACGEPLQHVSQQFGHKRLQELQAYVGVVVHPAKDMRELFGTWGY
jgi:integrase